MNYPPSKHSLEDFAFLSPKEQQEQAILLAQARTKANENEDTANENKFLKGEEIRLKKEEEEKKKRRGPIPGNALYGIDPLSNTYPGFYPVSGGKKTRRKRVKKRTYSKRSRHAR